MGDARRRGSLALKTPRNLTPRTQRQQVSAPQRQCLMAQAGQCRLSFVTLGKENQWMCARHWALVPEDVRQQLQADFATATAAFQVWQQSQEAAVAVVRKVIGAID
jgi:hypothetical protein